MRNALEHISSSLPFTANFDFDLDTSIYLLLTTLIVDAQLDDVAIFEGERPRLDVSVGQPNVVEKGARGRLAVFQEELERKSLRK